MIKSSNLDEVVHNFHNVFYLFISNTRISAEKESIVHYAVGIDKISNFPMCHIQISRLPKKIAGKEVSGLHKMLTQMIGQFRTCKSGSLPDGHGKGEPGGIAAFYSLGKNETIFVFPKSGRPLFEICAPSGTETIKFLQLLDTDGGLNVRSLKIVADMGIDIFVVIPLGKIAIFS